MQIPLRVALCMVLILLPNATLAATCQPQREAVNVTLADFQSSAELVFSPARQVAPRSAGTIPGI